MAAKAIALLWVLLPVAAEAGPDLCYFVHGAGNSSEGGAHPDASGPERGEFYATEDGGARYWGGRTVSEAADRVVPRGAEAHTPGCDKRFFFHYNSIDTAFDDVRLSSAVCQFLALKRRHFIVKNGLEQMSAEARRPPSLGRKGSTRPHSPGGSPFLRIIADPSQTLTHPISGARIYAHSMGNLVVAAAIRGGFCRLDRTPGSVLWFASGAPWAGSVVADLLIDNPTVGKRIVPGRYDAGGSVRSAYQSLSTRYVGGLALSTLPEGASLQPGWKHPADGRPGVDRPAEEGSDSRVPTERVYGGGWSHLSAPAALAAARRGEDPAAAAAVDTELRAGPAEEVSVSRVPTERAYGGGWSHDSGPAALAAARRGEDPAAAAAVDTERLARARYTEEIFQIARAHVTGAVCGRSARGLGKEYFWGLKLLGQVGFGHDAASDGMVDFSTCVAPWTRPGERAPARFLSSKVGTPFFAAFANHNDLKGGVCGDTGALDGMHEIKDAERKLVERARVSDNPLDAEAHMSLVTTGPPAVCLWFEFTSQMDGVEPAGGDGGPAEEGSNSRVPTERVDGGGWSHASASVALASERRGEDPAVAAAVDTERRQRGA
jgi:hypothetical protein